MRLFQLWFRHDGSGEQLLATFRMWPSRKVWNWFIKQRGTCIITMEMDPSPSPIGVFYGGIFYLDPSRFRISSSVTRDLPADEFPDMSKIRVVKVAPGKFKLEIGS